MPGSQSLGTSTTGSVSLTFLGVRLESCIPASMSSGKFSPVYSQVKEFKLAFSTIKCLISALSILFHRPIASHSSVLAFVQGVIRTALSVRPPLCPWDLNLVLAVRQKQPFEPMWHIPLVFST